MSESAAKFGESEAGPDEASSIRQPGSPIQPSAAQDRFICRREGHVPSLRVTRQNATTEKGATYLTTCARCFKVYEEVMPDAR